MENQTPLTVGQSKALALKIAATIGSHLLAMEVPYTSEAINQAAIAGGNQAVAAVVLSLSESLG